MSTVIFKGRTPFQGVHYTRDNPNDLRNPRFTLWHAGLAIGKIENGIEGWCCCFAALPASSAKEGGFSQWYEERSLDQCIDLCVKLYCERHNINIVSVVSKVFIHETFAHAPSAYD